MLFDFINDSNFTITSQRRSLDKYNKRKIQSKAFLLDFLYVLLMLWYKILSRICYIYIYIYSKL